MTDVTRRTLLGSAAAGAVGLRGSPPAEARGRAPSRVFSQGVGEVAGVSAVLDAARPFVLAGVQWSAPRAPRIEIRARRRGGRWSRWALASVSGHEPDRSAGGGVRSGEPLWFGPADQVQLRAVPPVGGVTLHFVAADAVPSVDGVQRFITSAPYALVDVNLPAGPGQPPIIARSAWAGRRHPPTSGPYYGSIELAFVHHTENPNGYSPGQVPAMLLAIYDYHRYTRGYFDIAYNFVIDAYGRIWEARAGGVDQPVVGAHAGGYNSVSTGVAILGSFMSSLPSAAAIAALQRLLAWKLALHGIPAQGKVRVEVNPSDAFFYTPFAPGQRVLLPRIAGHRDGDLTSCPGTDLYYRLPGVRTNVHGQAGTLYQLSLAAAETSVAPGTAVALSGAFVQPGVAPVAGAPVQIQSVSGDGVLDTLTTVVTGADGAWSATLPVSESAVLRAVHATGPAAVSNLVVVGVVPVVTLALASSSPVQVTGTIQPVKPVTVSVYKLVKGRRKLVSSRRLRASGGTFRARLSLGRRPRGQYVIVARAAADAISLAGASAALTVTV